MQNCYQYAGADTGELSMVFSFHHLKKVDYVSNGGLCHLTVVVRD